MNFQWAEFKVALRKQRHRVAIGAMLFWVSASIIAGRSAQADEVSREFSVRINRANEALRNNNLEAAIAEYDRAAEISPDRDELVYNKAVAHFRNGDVASAKSMFSQAAASLDGSLAARARFNAGNCHYATALQLRDENKTAAIEQLQAAIDEYRSALSLDPTDADARVNTELAAKLIHQMQQEQQQENKPQEEPESQQSDQQQSDQQQGDQQQSDQQQSDQQQNDQQQNDQQQNDQQQNDQQQNDQQQSDQQQNGESEQRQGNAEDRSQKPSDEGISDQQSDRQTPPENPDHSSGQPDQDAGEEMSQSDSGNSDQPTPEGELESVNEPQQQASGSLADGELIRDGEMTEEEARKMLQAIRDRDMLRRLRREAAQRSRHIPVDRDW